MTILHRVTQSSKTNFGRFLLLTKKDPSSLSSNLLHRSRHVLATTNGSSKCTSISTFQHDANTTISKKNIRYVNIPPNRGSGAAGSYTGDNDGDDDLILQNDIDTFNEDDYFNSTDMEFYDDMTNNNNTSSNSSSPSLESLYDETPQQKTAREMEEELDYERRQKIRDELDSRTGRLWEDPWALTDEDWSSGKTFDDLPDWSEQLCSRISKERVKLHPDGVPTLDQLAKLQHESSALQHPALGNPKPYLKHRKQEIYNTIYDAVVSHAKPKVTKILSMEQWDEKQNAIDDLFEEIHDQVRYGGRKTMKNSNTKKNKKKGDGKNSSSTNSNVGLQGMSDEEYKEYMSVVLGSQPNFPKLVQSALENYLKSVVKDERMKAVAASSSSSSQSNDKDGTENDDNDGEKEEEMSTPTTVHEPIFMDILKAPNSTVDEDDVPKLIAPIKPHTKDGPGRMLEEWELSAKRDTKRIMLRECMTEVAKSMVETQDENSQGGSRIFISGREGVGKSTTLAAVVASARSSGHIVLYIPDGRRLSHLGFYIEPNVKSKADGDILFDMPILTNEICKQFLECHEKELDGMIVPTNTMKKFLTADQLQKTKDLPEPKDDSYSLVELLKIGSENVTIGTACYRAVLDTLMNQTDTPFTVVMDEFNCYFGHGHYFHGQYDPEVKKPIPLNKITLFKHFMDAIGVEKLDDGSVISKEASPMKRGSIIVGTSESHAIKRTYTASLEKAAISAGCKFVTVPQYSPLEVEHILANFEIIGVGRLRFDRGATVMNNQEVSFLRMVSGGVGQRLLDACIH